MAGYSANSSNPVTKNTVNIAGGAHTGHIHGGFSSGDDVDVGGSTDNKNLINISGGTFSVISINIFASITIVILLRFEPI